MITDDRHDAILVKIYDSETQNYISSYYTTAINETLKMFITAKECHVETAFNDNDESVNGNYNDVYIVDDVRLSLGSHESIPVIEVYIL